MSASLDTVSRGNHDMNENNKKHDIHKHWGRLGRSVLNGMIGDYLEKENNPLAIKMGFYNSGLGSPFFRIFITKPLIFFN